MARNDHDRHQLIQVPELAQDLQSVHPWHLDVEEYQIGAVTLDTQQTFLPARREDGVVAVVFEDHLERIADRDLVVDDQDAVFHESPDLLAHAHL